MPEESVPQGDFCTVFPVVRNQENAIENLARELLAALSATSGMLAILPS